MCIQDFIKDDNNIAVKIPTQPDPSLSSNLAVVKQKTPDDETQVRHSLEDASKSNPEDDAPSKTIVLEPIDLSPLVDELICSSPFDVGKEFENLVQSSTADDSNTNSNGNNVTDVFVGVLPVLDVALNVPDTAKSDGEECVSDSKEKERITKQFGPAEKQDPASRALVMQDLQESNVNLTTKKIEEEQQVVKCVVSSAQTVSSDVVEPAESKLKGASISKQVQELSSSGSFPRFELNVGLKHVEKVENRIIETDKRAKTPDHQGLLKNSKPEETTSNDENVTGTSQDENSGIVSAQEPSEINSRKKEPACSESCSSVSSLNYNIETTEDKNTPDIAGTNCGNNFTNQEDKVDTTGGTNEMLKSNAQDETGLTKVLNKVGISTQAEESCQTMETREIQSVQESNKDDEKHENTDEYLSGSELGSPEGNLVRTSNRKRKAPPPRDLSVHPPGWVRSALQ